MPDTELDSSSRREATEPGVTTSTLQMGRVSLNAGDFGSSTFDIREAIKGLGGRLLIFDGHKDPVGPWLEQTIQQVLAGLAPHEAILCYSVHEQRGHEPINMVGLIRNLNDYRSFVHEDWMLSVSPEIIQIVDIGSLSDKIPTLRREP